MRIILILSTLLRLLLPLPEPILAESILFNSNSTSISFPNTITFETSISSDVKIADVQLIYGVKQDTCGEVEAIAYPDITPSTRVDASWEWDMRQSGSLPPGAEIWWQWQVTDENGLITSSSKQTVIWLDNIHSWNNQQKGKIRLHSYSMDKNQISDLLNTASAALDRLSKQTGIQPVEMIDLYIYANTDDMRDAILYEAGWTGGLAYPEHNIVLIGISADQFDWGKRTEAHEITHVLVGDYTFSCLGSLPTWLSEGLAVFGEGGPESAGEQLFKQALGNDTLLSFKVLSGGFSEDPGKADLSYSQSFYMVKYLIDSFGQEKINQLLISLSQGADLDASLTDIYGFDLNGFEGKWREALGAKPVSASVSIATPTPTIIPTIHPYILGEVIETPIQPTDTAQSLNPTITETLVTPVADSNPISNTTKTILAILLGCTCVIGILGIAFITFLLAQDRAKKRRLLSITSILILSSIWMGLAKGTVQGQSSQSTPFPINPTSTPYTPPQNPSGVYSNPDVGIRLEYPVQIQLTETDPGSSVYATLTIGTNEVFGSLFGSSMDINQSLEEVGKSIRETSFSDLDDIRIVEEKEIKLKNGGKAWYSLADGVLTEYNQKIRIGMVTVLGSTQAISLQMYSIPENYKYYNPQIEQMYKSLQVTQPLIRGFARDQVLLLAGGESSNPSENDPATSHSSGDTLVFSGLVQNNQNLRVAPDLAASWETNPEGTIYTFHLQPKALFHNGRPVTVEDVVYSWERAANQSTGSDLVMTYLGDIVGVKEMHGGQADHISGLKMIDEHTLQVTIDSPKPYFIQKLTYPTAFIVDRENIALGETWYLTPNGTGPYKLTRWESMKEKIYERFDDYYGNKPRIPAIVVSLYSGDSTRLYESGSIDIAGIGSYNVARFSDPSETLHNQLQSVVNMCTSYITLDVTQPPFDDVKVRQAFAMALDKEKYIQVVLSNAALPANGLYPPALPGYDLQVKGWEYDPAKAIQLLKESKYPLDQMPAITFSVAGYGSSVSSGEAAWVQMWEQNLGIKINVQNIEPERYMQVIAEGKHGQLISQGWCADYPDPENFANVLFHSGVAMNYGNYNNPELDALLDKASVETDVTKRIKMYQQAEQIIITDVPAIFTTHSMSYVLVKPFIKGYVLAPMTVPIERYLWIDPEFFSK